MVIESKGMTWTEMVNLYKIFVEVLGGAHSLGDLDAKRVDNTKTWLLKVYTGLNWFSMVSKYRIL